MEIGDLRELEDEYGIAIITSDPVDEDTVCYMCKSENMYQVNIDTRGVVYVRRN